MFASLIAVSALMVSGGAHVIPTRYVAGHFYAVPRTIEGKSLRLLVDTGGGGGTGMYWLTAASAKRLGLRPATCSVEGQALTVAQAPVFVPGKGLPASNGPCPGDVEVQSMRYDSDGQIGQGYLGSRAWTFDYPRHRLLVWEGSMRGMPEAHRVRLGFLRNARGEAVMFFPRITVRIAGQAMDMLLDTGATAHPTPQGKRAAGTETVDGVGVTSYITTGQLERWHKAHPQWPLIQHGDDLLGPRFSARLIRVPEVEIAGWKVGPVWFTERPNAAFHKGMARYMDRRPEGAIGGNVLSHFRMTLDYPQATGWFQCGHGCAAMHGNQHRGGA